MATASLVNETARNWTRSRVLAARFAWFAVLYNVLVIVWGALVRATGSGAGCGNHWPLCNGQVVPVAPQIHTIIEFTHRAMTGGSAFVVLLMVVWGFRSTRRGDAARVAAAVSLGLLLNEALLGALLVKLGYVTTNQSAGRVVLLSVHLSNTLLLLAALTATAVLLGREIRRPTVWRAIRETGWAWLALLATMVVGVTGSLAALGDTLFPAPSLSAALAADLSRSAPMLIRTRWIHPVSAVLAAVCVVYLLARARREGETGLSNVLVGLLGLQFVLGVADVLLLAPVSLQLIHLAGADVFWIALVTLLMRLVVRRGGTGAGQESVFRMTVPGAVR